MTTIIISDLHLGAYNCQTALLASLLQSDYDRLVINGDTVDHFDFRRFLPEHWEILRQLRLIARERELVLVRGNHDGARHADEYEFGPLHVLGRMLETDPVEDFTLWVGRRRFLVLHGDQFDDSLNLTRLGAAADSVYRSVQKCSRPVAAWLKGQVKHWSGVIPKVKQQAIERARRQNCQGVITGHTHFSDDEMVGGVHFLNTGCWVDLPCTYLLVRDAQIELRHAHAVDDTVPAKLTLATRREQPVEALTAAV